MKACCDAKADELMVLRGRQGRVLKWLLVINTLMFVTEASFGLAARSSALLADSLDMFGDASVYALSLFVLHRGAVWRTRAALAKGTAMAAFGTFVLAAVVVRLISGVVPHAETMGVIGVLALIANATCLALLYRYRSDDLNMRSTWLCSRNDIIANVSVLAAAGAVALVDSNWPDLLVGTGIAALFLKDAVAILRAGMSERNATRAGAGISSRA